MKSLFYNINIHRLCIAILLSIIATNTYTQNVVKHISNSDGLSNNSVNCIFQDSENNMWIGTWDGLNVYNGRDIQTFRYTKNNKQGISNNIIRQIIEQNSDYIWISTDYGLNRWDKNKEEFTQYYLGMEHNVPKQEKSFLIGATILHNIVCYVKDKGLFFFNEQLQRFVSTGSNINEKVKDFVIDSNNNIYFLFENGTLTKYKIEENNKSVNFVKQQYIEQHGSISKIFLTNDFLILNYPDYIKILDHKNQYPTTINTDRHKTISQIIYRNGSLLFSLYEGGCMEYDLNTKQYKSMDMIPDKVSIFTMYSGSQGILWVGTDGQGLLKIYEYNSPFTPVRTNYPVRSFCRLDDDKILIGTKGDGIKLFNKSTGLVSDYLNINNGLLSNSVYAIKKNNSNDIFIGTEGEGLNILLDGKKLIRINIPAEYPHFKAVYNIHFSHNDKYLWLGTSGYGLIKIELLKKNNEYQISDLKQYTLNNNIIYSIEEGDNGDELWLATRGGGINKFNITAEKFENLENINSKFQLSSNDVLVLHKSEANNLWAGTSHGLNDLNISNGWIENYTTSNGLPNNTIHGILEDENKNIWISSNKGISYINTATKSITNYSAKDGLQNDEFADGGYYKDADNNFYFGGVSGFNHFAPQNIHRREYQPTLNLSALIIYNTPQNTRERIENGILKLSSEEPYVTLRFIARDFINNENCEYDYRLQNFSDEWIKNGNNPNIVFTKLPPGKYKLEVKCTNGDKVWSTDIYTLDIDVAYPWWLSMPAFVAYFIFISIIIYIVQSVIRNRIRMNRQLLLEHIEKQHQQKINESKLNFFTNVAHEFFTPLTLIYGPAQHLLEKSNLDSYSKRYIQIIKNNADRMQKLISELMDFRKAESGHTALLAENIDLKILINYIIDNYTEIAEENKIELKINTENISTFVTDRNSLEKIFFNLISNAFKYTPGKGYISINMKQDSERLCFVIRNSGKGLTNKQMSEIFNKFRIFENSKLQNTTSTGIGLSLTKSLVELLDGIITVNSELGQYVEFSVTLNPIKNTQNNAINERDNENMTVNDDYIQERKSITILIVEDEKNIRELLKDILNPYYNIQEAENGEDAINSIQQNTPNIIITDILMPHLDGIGLIDRLKSNSITSHIPIISISAKSSTEDYINAYEHGADMYITKPFHPRHVLVTVDNLISKHSLLKDYFGSSLSTLTIKDGITIHKEDEYLLQEITSYIEQNIDDESLSPNSISEFLGISKATLYRKLKDLTDKTPSEFVRTIRLKHASQLLISTKLTVSEIMFKSGFSNKSYFYREFSKQYGKSPKDYRESI